MATRPRRRSPPSIHGVPTMRTDDAGEIDDRGDAPRVGPRSQRGRHPSADSAEAEIKPAYLIAGTDEAKIARLGRGSARAPSARAGPGRWSSSRPGRAGGPRRRGPARLAGRDLADRSAPLPARRRGRGLGQEGRRGGGEALGSSRPTPRSRWSPTASRRAAGEGGEGGRAARCSPSTRRGARAAEAARRRGRELGFELDLVAAAAAGRAPGPAPAAAPERARAPRAVGGEGGRVGPRTSTR